MAAKATRGRPKGSGINDDKILAKINGLLAKDPDLKATTAIKMAGITDPSSIRRLRDKLKSSPTKRKKTAAKKASTKKAPATRKASTTRTRAKAKTASTRKSTTKKAPARKAAAARKTVKTRTTAGNRAAAKKITASKSVKTRKAPSAAASAPDGFNFANPFVEMANNPFADMTQGMKMPTELGSLDIEDIVTSTVEKQIQLYESALKFSPLAHLLRQQAFLTDMMLTVLRTQKELARVTKPKF